MGTGQEGQGKVEENVKGEAETRGMLANLLVESEAEAMDYSQEYEIRGEIIEAIKELLAELEVLYKNVSDQAINHIHADETILTVGKSELVKAFLLEAARQKRTFEVFVAEAAPMCEGQQMARELAEAGIKTTLINDAALFALMSRTHKVLIGTHAVMANGGLICQTGGHTLALAAKQHSVPLVVLAGLHQLCPMYPFDQDTFSELASPMQIFDLCADQLSGGDVSVSNPIFDYVPPELIDLHLTNFGAHNPSYIYRLLAEYYHPDDYELD